MIDPDEPGTITVTRNADGTRSVMEANAPRLLRVAVELLTAPDLMPDFIEPDGTLRCDTAGEYRYRFAYVDVKDPHAHIYERVIEEAS